MQDGATRGDGAPAEASAPPSRADVARWQANYQDETSDATVLRALAAKSHRDPSLAPLLDQLAAAEQRHADYWASRLAAAGVPAPAPHPRAVSRLLLALVPRLGTRALLPLVTAGAVRGVDSYRKQPDAAPLLPTASTVARTTAGLQYGGAAQATVESGEHRRSAAGNGSLRAAVFGVSDGLVSNLSLVMGVAGAAPDNHWILLSGLAGLLAGAFSMAGGEFISMLSQRELFEKELALEREHIRTMPEVERANLARLYEQKGLAAEQAQAVAAQFMADPNVALDTIAREQLGLNPEELGSPQAAAAASFVSFALGAVVPILPFVFARGEVAVVLAALAGALGLFVVGALLSLFTARNPLVSGGRMMAMGLGSAAATFVIGRLIGVSVGG